VRVRSRHYDDDWTVETWRIEPKLRPAGDDVAELDDVEQNPPLWKDVTLASVIAALLWGAAAAMFS
jgi:hypothetical protein